jgi:hypothetical protein
MNILTTRPGFIDGYESGIFMFQGKMIRVARPKDQYSR